MVLFEGRFFLGVGTGEALNEHVLGLTLADGRDRQEMLAEAVGVMRELWKGDTVDFHGKFFIVESACLYDVPDDPIPGRRAQVRRRKRPSWPLATGMASG